MILNRFLFLLFILSSVDIYAQFDYNAVLPPSPTASALGQYGDVPISLYTGTPNVSIPLGGIKGSELELPISLSYMAKGIKVEDNASWVGAGWNLNATGVITRTVRGLEDGFAPRVTFPLPEDVAAMKDLLVNIQGGSLDTESDLYFFNFPGYSGSFSLDQTGEVILESTKAIRIKKETTLFSKFRITVEDGTQYIFEEAENTTFYGAGTLSNNSALYLKKIISPTGKESIDFFYEAELCISYSLPRPRKWARPDNILRPESAATPFGRTVITGKRLARVTSNFGQNIEFVPDNVARQDLGLTEASVAPKALREIQFYDQNNAIKKRLVFDYETIETVTPYVQQAPGDPPQNETGYANYRLYLKSVGELSPDGSASIPPHTFTYIGRTASNKDLLPSKLSASQDHWGYFNGTGNITLLPGYSGPFALYDPEFNVTSTACPGELEYISRVSFNVAGADRSPNGTYGKYGTLNRITYPTGGRTDFEFEAHKYVYENNTAITKTIQAGQQLYLSGSGSQLEDSHPLELNGLTVAGRFIFEFNVTCWDPNTHQPVPCNSPGAAVNFDKFQGNSFALFNAENQEIISVKWTPGDGGFWIYRKGLVDTNIGMLLPDESGFITRQIEGLALREGNYTLKITKDADCDTDAFGWLYYDQKVDVNINDPSEALMAGGLRIKKIENFDENNTSVGLKTYEYGSGVLLDKPRYVTYVFMYPDSDPLAGKPSWFQYCGPRGAGDNGLYGVDSFPWLEFSCGPYNALGYTQGSPIGYATVTENHNGNGSIRYSYTTGLEYPDNGFDASNTVHFLFWDYAAPSGPGSYTTWNHYNFNDRVPWPFISQDNLDRKRGFLTNALYTDNLGRTKLWKATTPIMEDLNVVHGMIIKNLRHDVDWIYSVYKYSTGFVNVSSSWETQTDLDNNTSLSKGTNFWYESPYHKQITKQEFIDSDESSYTTEYRYPDDYENITDPNHVIAQMKSDNLHMVGTPVETRAYKNGNIIGGSLNLPGKFNKEFGGFFVAPGSIYKIKEGIANPATTWSSDPVNPDPAIFSKEAEFSFNEQGNLSKVVPKDQVKISFFWSQDIPYPLAKAKNAEPDQIFFNSFEDEGTLQNQANTAQTGKHYLSFGDYNFNLNAGFNPSSPSTLKMSYWYWISDHWEFSGELNFANALSSPGTRLDEIRVYPAGAQMTTYIYDPLIGITSQTDPNNVTSWYEYDEFGRLKLLRDNDRNIVQSFDYHYKDQD